MTWIHRAGAGAKPGQPAPVKKQGSHMKLTTGIIFLGMVAGTALAQNPAVIENTRNTMRESQQKQGCRLERSLGVYSGRARANPAAPASSAGCQKPANKIGVKKISAPVAA